MMAIIAVAARTKRARIKCGWTIPDLAEHSGLGRNHIYKIENGDRGNIRIETLVILATTLGVSADWLLGLTSKP